MIVDFGPPARSAKATRTGPRPTETILSRWDILGIDLGHLGVDLGVLKVDFGPLNDFAVSETRFWGNLSVYFGSL